MNPKLSVEIGADVKGMEAALKKADALLKQHERNYKGVQNAISQNTQKSQQLEKSISRLSTEYQRGNISQAKFSKETDRLTNELSQVNNSTADYQKELRRLDREMDRVAQSTANYANASKRTTNASDQAATGLGRMSKSASARATPALMSLGQVMQDAPYGIQGVANNIQQLTMQLGYLSKGAGGTKGVFKALVGSLMGPAGILIAVSAVTSAMVAFSNSGVRLSDVLNFVTGNSNKAAQAQRKLAESYREAQGDVMAEMAVLNSLVEVARDETRSRKERQRAIDAVNDKFPELHENLRLETVNSEKAKIAIDKLTDSLLRQAKIEGVKGLIADTYGEIAEIAQKSAVDSASWWQIVSAAILPVIDKGGSVMAQGFAAQGEAIDKAREKLKSYEGTLKTLIGQDITTQGVFTSVDPDKSKELSSDDLLKSLGIDSDELQAEIDLEKMLSGLDGLDELIAEKGENISAKVREALRDPLSQELDMSSLYSAMNLAEENFFANSDEEWDAYLERMRSRMEEQKQMAQLLGQAFSSMANQLIDGLVEGQMSMADFVKSTVKMVGKMLVSIAAQAIANSVLSATQTAAASGPAAALVLPGLLGATVAATKGALPAFAEGGIVGGNSLYGDKILARLNSKELILNTDQQKELYGQLQAPNMIMSTPNEPVEITGETFISGDKIRVIYKRAGDNRGRVS